MKPCEHEPAWNYYGGIAGYYYCETENRWWEVQLSGETREVDKPYTRDLLSDFLHRDDLTSEQ